MPAIRSCLSAIALIAFPFIMTAQQGLAQTATDSDTSDPAAESGTVSDGLSMGEVADDSPKPGDTYIREEFGDWALRCIVVAEQDDPCQMYQLLADEQGAPIAEFTLFRLPEGNRAAAGATIVVPLETLLQEQLSIQVDDAAAKRYPFAFCNAVGCYARIGLTQEDIDAYKRGASGIMSIVPVAAPDQRVNVELSLEGFTAAYEKVTELQR